MLVYPYHKKLASLLSRCIFFFFASTPAGG